MSEAAREQGASGASGGTAAEGESGAQTAAGGGGSSTTGEQVAALDGEFKESLEKFDGELLREQEILEKRREESAADRAGGSSGSMGSSGGYGGSESTSGSSSSGESGSEGSDAAAATEGGGAGSSKPQSAGGGDSVGDDSEGRVPSDVGDGSDDDIVARQLREAAMKEEDPELREKLWDEYRAYKSGNKG